MQKVAALGALFLVVGCGAESPSETAAGGTGGVGVGGTGGSPGTGAQPGMGGSPGIFAWPPEKPSFTLTTVMSDKTMTGPGFAKARLDFKQSGNVFEAALDSETSCSVEVSTSNVILKGCAAVGPVTVEQVVLLRVDGLVSNYFEATSKYVGLYQGDLLMNETTKFSGTVELDTTSPELELQASGSLPWQGLQVTADEGVDEKQLLAAATVAPVSGAAPPITWKASPGKPAWSGATGMVGHFGDWAALADGPSFDVSLGAVADLNGNPSAAVKGTVKTLAVGKPVVAHDFEGGTLGLFAWGDAVLVPAGTSGVCESGVCVSTGKGDGCHGVGGGLVGLLETSGKSKVRLRSRIVADAATNVPKFLLRLHAPSGEEATTPVGHFDGAPTAPVLTLDYGATFGDDVVPLPAGGTVVGFELVLPGKNDGGFCGMSPGPSVALLVEKIAAE